MNERQTNVTDKQDKILIIAGGKMYGPFLPTTGHSAQDNAQSWVDTRPQPLIGLKAEFYSIWEPASAGTPELAHECGTLLKDVEEETGSNRTSRRASAG